MRRRRKERERERGKRSFQSRQIEFRGSFCSPVRASVRPCVRPTQPLTRSPMRWLVAVLVLRGGGGGPRTGDGGDGFRVNGITRVTGWTTAGGREGGSGGEGEGRVERAGINHFVRKVRSIILISIDHRRQRQRRPAVPRFTPSFRRSACVCVLCTTTRPTCNPRGKKDFARWMQCHAAAAAVVRPSVRPRPSARPSFRA